MLFDKLEDQNLHLASQLARHQEDLRNFYNKMSNQNEELKDMLNNLDLSKLEEIEAARAKDAAEAGLAGAGAAGGFGGDGGLNVVNANITGGINRTFKFMGGEWHIEKLG